MEEEEEGAGAEAQELHIDKPVQYHTCFHVNQDAFMEVLI